jgi:hypothetical protein
MPCVITLGRQEVCKDSVGGLAGVYFVNYTTGSFVHQTASDFGSPITAMPSASMSAYYYELKGNSSYTETVNSSRDNGTTFFQQELTLNLKRLTNEMTTQLRLLAYGRPQIFVHTMQGDTLLVGEREGADLTGGTIQTGGTLGDLYGYSLTFSGIEQFNASFVSGSTYGNPFGQMTVKPVVVYGTTSEHTN